MCWFVKQSIFATATYIYWNNFKITKKSVKRQLWGNVCLSSLGCNFHLATSIIVFMVQKQKHYSLIKVGKNRLWSIFDCDILYFLFIECTGAFTFLNEYRIIMALSLLFFRRNSIFHSRFFLSRLLYLALVNLKQSSVRHFLVFAHNFFVPKKQKKDF